MTDTIRPNEAFRLGGSAVIETLRAQLGASLHLEVPELYSPFDPKIHPETAHVQEQTIAWVRRVGLVEDERRLRVLRDQRIGWLAARGFNTATLAALELAADWTTLFCLIDDWTERVADLQILDRYLSHLLRVLRGEEMVRDDDAMALAFHDMGDRLRAASSPAWFSAFAARVADLFDAYRDESQNRAQATIPDFAHYLELRDISIGLRVLFEFCELTNGIRLPEHVRADPAVKALVTSACRIVGWANDIYTYKKEIVAGEIHNLVVVAAREHGLTLDQAIEWVVDMHDAETRAYEEALDDLPELDAEAAGELRRYAAMLTSWVRGHLDWAHETGRYVTADGQPPSSQRWDGFVASRRRPSLPPSSRKPGLPPPASSRRSSRLPPALATQRPSAAGEPPALAFPRPPPLPDIIDASAKEEAAPISRRFEKPTQPSRRGFRYDIDAPPPAPPPSPGSEPPPESA